MVYGIAVNGKGIKFKKKIFMLQEKNPYNRYR